MLYRPTRDPERLSDFVIRKAKKVKNQNRSLLPRNPEDMSLKEDILAPSQHGARNWHEFS
jgi:hypothetical protein